MRRHPRIPLSPQLVIDGGLADSAMPKDEAIGLQSVQNGPWRHAGIVSWDVLNSAVADVARPRPSGMTVRSAGLQCASFPRARPDPP
jgi:hypothetical protein